MLESFKRLFAHQAVGPEWRDVSEWARQHGLTFKRVREAEGFVIDGALDGQPWRLEWGPPQRGYIDGRELRIRMELRLPAELQMLVLAKPLMELLERQTYERFTEGMQTQIDTATPEEMRWLVMFPKVNLGTFRTLREHVGAVASAPPSVPVWLDGPLAAVLERALGGLLRGDPPFVLMTLRGRVYLRTQLIDPDPASLASAVAILEAAAVQAKRVALQLGESSAEWPSSSASTAWQNMGPDDPSGQR